jgi:hypothetical protein
MKDSSAKVPSSSKKWLTGHCFWLPSAEVATTVLGGIGRNLGALARPSEPLGRGVMPRVYLVRGRVRGRVMPRVYLVRVRVRRPSEGSTGRPSWGGRAAHIS